MKLKKKTTPAHPVREIFLMLFRLRHIPDDPRRKALPGLAVGPNVAKAKINLSADF